MDIVILTGAGISAESGIGTFRDKGGIWSRYDVKDVATPEGFARNPALVHDFYNMRRQVSRDAQPNAAHRALARLQAEWRRGKVVIITQNVDGLHERAGAQGVLDMHGAHRRALCAGCGHRGPAPEILHPDLPCPACAEPRLRPDVVWFGEMPHHLDRIATALSRAAIFCAIGTSGHVQPAAGFAARARAAGAHTVEINLAPSRISAVFAQTLRGPATQVVPDWVDGLLS